MVSIMTSIKKRILISLIPLMAFWIFVLPPASHCQELSREQIKGLDEQVQEIKSDVLGIAAELSLLEEKLIFPSNTQLAVFISLAPGETFRLDSVELVLDGRPAAQHLYTFKELEALRKGGVQRILTGNVRDGEHDLQVVVLGKSDSGSDFRNAQNFKINKDVGPGIVELSLGHDVILRKDW